MSGHDDDPTPPQGMPSVIPATSHQGLGSLQGEVRAGGGRADDGKGVAAGLTVTVAVHLAVLLTSLRLGRREGNVVAAAATQPAQQVVIETQLLKRGGGDFDPRRVVHRTTPTRAEREAPRQVALTHDPTAVQLRPDAGADEYMNAIVTGRRRAPRGNQDLAELERIAQMAAAEQASDPTAPPGPGDPTGSDHGTTTDPAQASRGAVAKLQEFFYANIHRTATLSGSERASMSVRVRLDETGVITNAAMGQSSGNEAVDADVLAQVQALESRRARIESLTAEELQAVGGRNITVALRPGNL